MQLQNYIIFFFFYGNENNSPPSRYQAPRRFDFIVTIVCLTLGKKKKCYKINFLEHNSFAITPPILLFIYQFCLINQLIYFLLIYRLRIYLLIFCYNFFKQCYAIVKSVQIRCYTLDTESIGHRCTRHGCGLDGSENNNTWPPVSRRGGRGSPRPAIDFCSPAVHPCETCGRFCRGQ